MIRAFAACRIPPLFVRHLRADDRDIGHPHVDALNFSRRIGDAGARLQHAGDQGLGRADTGIGFDSGGHDSIAFADRLREKI